MKIDIPKRLIDAFEYNHCVKKVWFSSFFAADRVAAKMSKHQPKKFVAYKCKFCYGYHVGHNPEDANGR